MIIGGEILNDDAYLVVLIINGNYESDCNSIVYFLCHLPTKTYSAYTWKQ